MIRPAEVRDLQAVISIARDCKPWLVAITPKWLLKELTHKLRWLIVLANPDGGGVLGFLIFSIEDGVRNIELVGVHKDHRRQGVANALLADITGPAITWIHPDNKASINLFKSLGWRQKNRKTKNTEFLLFELSAPV